MYQEHLGCLRSKSFVSGAADDATVDDEKADALRARFAVVVDAS